MDKLVYPADYLASGVSNVWLQLVQDPEFVRAYLRGLGLWAAQEQIDAQLIEQLSVPEQVSTARRRYAVPVILSDDDRGQGDALAFRLRRDNPVWLGPQPQGSGFQAGAVYTLGGRLETDLLAYPVGDLQFNLLASSPEDPEHVLVRGQDFELESRTILFRRGLDLDSLFVREDGRLVLWAVEATDRAPWVRQHIGYAVGAPHAAPELKDFLVQVWRAYNFGLTPARLGQGLGALLRLPVAQSAEQVEVVTSNTVITDARSYHVTGAAVEVGDTVGPGTSLDGAIQIFESERELTRLKAAVPALTVPADMLRSRSGPVSFQWDEQQWEDGRFKVIGSPAAIAGFWDAVRLDSGVRTGPVIPAEYVYRRALQHNLMIVVLDSSRIMREHLHNLRYLDLLLNTRSRCIGFMIILRFDTDSVYTDEYSDRTTDVCAHVCVDEAGAGVSARQLQYADSVHWTFIPACKEQK